MEERKSGGVLKYPGKKRKGHCVGRKAVVRQWNTEEKRSVKFIEVKKVKKVKKARMDLKVSCLSDISFDDRGNVELKKEETTLCVEETKQAEPQALADLAVPILSVAPYVPHNWGRRKKESKSGYLTVFLVWVFMSVLVVTMVGTMSLVHTKPEHSTNGQLGQQEELAADGDKPVILLSTKFKVPATNTFDEFSGDVRMNNFKVEKSRNKFAKPGD